MLRPVLFPVSEISVRDIAILQKAYGGNIEPGKGVSNTAKFQLKIKTP